MIGLLKINTIISHKELAGAFKLVCVNQIVQSQIK